jgi:nucleotide-binding universal stress UspA family protein
MFKHILLTVDGSEVSLEAARKGIMLAKCLRAKVTVLVVTVPWSTYFARELAVIVPDVVFPESEYEVKRHAEAARLLKAMETDAAAAGVPANCVHSRHAAPSFAIVDTAEHEKCDLIVVAPHGEHGLASLLVDSETMKVLTRSSIPVLVHRRS